MIGHLDCGERLEASVAGAGAGAGGGIIIREDNTHQTGPAITIGPAHNTRH